MPDVHVPKTKRKKKKVKDFKRQLYHDVIYDVLAPVRYAQRTGGFWAVHKG